jgi:hypothetical protein
MAYPRALWIAALVVAAIVVLWLLTFLVFGSGDESGPTISQIAR